MECAKQAADGAARASSPALLPFQVQVEGAPALCGRGSTFPLAPPFPLHLDLFTQLTAPPGLAFAEEDGCVVKETPSSAAQAGQCQPGVPQLDGASREPAEKQQGATAAPTDTAVVAEAVADSQAAPPEQLRSAEDAGQQLGAPTMEALQQQPLAVMEVEAAAEVHTEAPDWILQAKTPPGSGQYIFIYLAMIFRIAHFLNMIDREGMLRLSVGAKVRARDGALYVL